MTIFVSARMFALAASSLLTTPGPTTTTSPDTSCEPSPMISGSMYISDANFRASSEKSGREAYKARSKLCTVII